MGLHFKNDLIAKNSGWVITTPFTEDSTAPVQERYKALGQREMGLLRKILQVTGLFFVCLLSLGLALKIATIQKWREDLARENYPGYLLRKPY